jgi:hypothetical protein
MKQHSNYDHAKHLPDNRMQPNDSGINVWLQEQIIAHLGDDAAQCLIQDAAQHKEKRYVWMLDRMVEQGHTDLAEQYHQRRLAIEAQRRYKQCYNAYLSATWLATEEGLTQLNVRREV